MLALLEAYPEFQPMYEDSYRLCENTERVMSMFSEKFTKLAHSNPLKFLSKDTLGNNRLRKTNYRM